MEMVTALSWLMRLSSLSVMGLSCSRTDVDDVPADDGAIVGGTVA